ncbi:hypothetical protein ABZP36_002108 [Zizania latifolia]
MASFTRAQPLLFLALPLLLLLLSSLRAGEGAPNTAALSLLCNRAVYGVGDPFAASVVYVLAELLDDTPASSGREMYNVSPWGFLISPPDKTNVLKLERHMLAQNIVTITLQK